MALPPFFLVYLLPVIATNHQVRCDAAELTLAELHDVIKQDVRQEIREYVQRALMESEQKHAAQIASLRAETEARVQHVTDELTKKHAADMLALKEDFKKQIQDITVGLEMVANSIGNQDRSMNRDAHILEDPYRMNAKEIPSDGTDLSMDKPSSDSEKEIPSSEVTRNTDPVLHWTNRQLDTPSRIAFFATMGANKKQLGANHDIIFENVHTNFGNVYNAHHGTFIAPVDGVYMFTCTLLSFAPTPTHVNFVVNGSVVAKIDLDASGTVEQSSQTIIVQLHQGQDVSVQNRDPGATIWGDGYSTFSGFLLYEGLSEIPVVVG